MKKVMLGLAIMLSAIGIVSASNSWSDALTYSLSGSSWKAMTTSGYWLGQDKTTDDSKYYVNTVAKTMYSYPSVRLVNSNNESRSNTATTAKEGRYVTGTGNCGVIGSALYSSLKPAWNQLGTDTIKIQIKVM